MVWQRGLVHGMVGRWLGGVELGVWAICYDKGCRGSTFTFAQHTVAFDTLNLLNYCCKCFYETGKLKRDCGDE